MWAVNPMGDAKLPIALVLAMGVQLVGVVWYISSMVHKIEHLESNVVNQQELVENLSLDVDDLWQFCTFTENKWAEAYTSDMVYERLCGTKNPVKE